MKQKVAARKNLDQKPWDLKTGGLKIQDVCYTGSNRFIGGSRKSYGIELSHHFFFWQEKNARQVGCFFFGVPVSTIEISPRHAPPNSLHLTMRGRYRHHSSTEGAFPGTRLEKQVRFGGLAIESMANGIFDNTPKVLHGTSKWWFPIGISFSSGWFSGSMLVFGSVHLIDFCW